MTTAPPKPAHAEVRATPPTASPTRPDTREGPTSSADPVIAARERAAQIRAALDSIPELPNEFDIPPGYIPQGWSYQWIRASTVGKEDPDNLMARAATGWQPVPLSRHRTMMPDSYKGSYIERKGLILMERPLEITEEMRRRDQKIAKQVVRDKEISLGETPANTLPRDADPRTAPRIESDFYREVPQ